jgi:hypothetical protein
LFIKHSVYFFFFFQTLLPSLVHSFATFATSTASSLARSQCGFHLSRSCGIRFHSFVPADVGSGLSTLLRRSLVESFRLFVQLNPVDSSLNSFNGNSFININNNTGPLPEIMLVRHLRTCIAHINLLLGSYLR